MPNQIGGKNYKKSKHGGTTKKVVMIERQPDQMYARILRNLGGDRMVVFCNDGKQRLCLIRGGMRKRVWMRAGDVVLISIRDFEKKAEFGSTELEKGDIIAKYDDDLIPLLKKEKDFNQVLLRQLETIDGKVLQDLGTDDRDAQRRALNNLDDDTLGIEFGEDSEEEGGESGEGKDGKSRKKTAIDEARKQKEKEVASEINNDGGDTFEIDDI